MKELEMQVPLTVITKGKNAGGWKTFIEAKFDERPSNLDIDAASASIGYHPRGYILSKPELKKIDNKDDVEDGLWVANWEAILD